jgi:hypothetical protein
VIWLNIALSVLAESSSHTSPQSVGFELAIWKWVVIAGVGTFVITFLLKRIADVMATKKTESIIEDVVGKEEAKKSTDWVDDDDDDDNDEQ